MRRNHLLIVFVILAVVLSFISWTRSKRSAVTDTALSNQTAQSSIVPASKASTGRMPGPQQVEHTYSEAEVQSMMDTNYRIQHEEMLQKQGDVSLYGRVVDQNGNAVSGVNIIFELGYYPSDYMERVNRVIRKEIKTRREAERLLAPLKDQIVIITDAAGKFQLSGKSGEDLTLIQIKKKGYSHWSDSRCCFRYGTSLGEMSGGSTNYWRPDSNFVITGWKEGKMERLIGSERKIFFLHNPNFETHVNMLKKTSSNDDTFFDLIITRNGDIEDKSLNAVYEYTMTVPHGGIQLTEDPLPFRAPMGGYVDVLKLQTTRGEDLNYNRKKFYLKLRDGRVYASMVVLFRVNGMILNILCNAEEGNLLVPKEDLMIRDSDKIAEFDRQTRGAE